MIQVRSTEFKNNVGKFLKLSQKEDILIIRNGKAVAKISAASKNEKELAYNRLLEIIQKGKPITESVELESLREERLSKYDNIT
jgi:antitoxin (DNA-binding transcriptional repressor) of toxin-antitoxin stability system